MSEAQTFYDAVGGAETFRKLIGAFYRRVPDDPILGPMYPHDELAEAEERLRLFLEQYWGGPRTDSDQRGHPDGARPLAGADAGRARRDRPGPGPGPGDLDLPGDGRAQHGQHRRARLSGRP